VSPRERITSVIRAAAALGEPALIAYLTAGFPSRARFRDHLRALAARADIVEVGVPFTDPMADGVTIQRASLAALAQGQAGLEGQQGRPPLGQPCLPVHRPAPHG